MKLSSILLTTTSVSFAQEEGSGQLDQSESNTDTMFSFTTSPKAAFASLELTQPIYQNCLTPLTCGNKIGARCDGFGESCAQSNPDTNPCDYHCVSECLDGHVSRIIEYEGRGSFRKCIPESELDDENMLICSSPEDGPAQFEIQGNI